MNEIISIFQEIKECDYKDRHYSVRDNGAIYRHQRDGHLASKLDNTWTFGTKDKKNGYMFYGGVSVHRVVATAFHGVPKDPNLVVDHIDTNKCNNRPENLHWVTRLENALNNPITRKRIEIRCGSIEAFLKNPAILQTSPSDQNIEWMRTVTKEEAAKCLKNLTRWANEDKQPEGYKPTGGGIGERVYQDIIMDNKGFGEAWDPELVKIDYRTPWDKKKEQIAKVNQEYYEAQYALKPSLTTGAMQQNWKTSVEFPLCPQNISSTPLQDYLTELKAGEIYCQCSIYKSTVLKAELSSDGHKIAVLCATGGVTNFALSEITFEDNLYIHTNIRTFFSNKGAEMYYTKSLGKEWTGGDVLEEYC